MIEFSVTLASVHLIAIVVRPARLRDQRGGPAGGALAA
jgi:hypothetical protein